MAEKLTPLPHQLAMRDFAIANPYCAIFADMGAMKSASTLLAVSQLIDDLDVSKILIVATKRVAKNTWPKELSRWSCFEHLTHRVLLAEDFQFERKEVTIKRKGKTTTVKRLVPAATPQSFLTDERIHTISRDNLVHLVQLLGKRNWHYDMTVLDESSGFRDQDTKRVKAVRVLRKHGLLGRLIELSGTPRPKSLLDLWSQVYLLDQGQRLGKTLTEYRDHYFTPDKRSKDQIFSWKPKSGAEAEIFAKISDICMSLLPEDCGAELPPRTFHNIDVELTGRGRHAYDTMERDSLLQLTGENGATSDSVAPNRAALVGKLLQIASGAVYDENGEVQHIHDAKLDALEELVESMQGRPLLVSYWFKHELTRLKARFPNAVDLNDSDDTEDRWNRGEIEMMLIHPASGAHGLNLQFNEGYGVWLGPVHDLELYLQLNKRLHRPGRKTPVRIYHLLAENTIEGAVLASLDPKNQGQDRLLQAVRIRVEELKR